MANRFFGNGQTAFFAALAVAVFVAIERPAGTGAASAVASQADAASQPEALAIGSPAPDFRLPGIDGKTYSLASFKNAKVLVVLFTAVHCPTAEVYETASSSS